MVHRNGQKFFAKEKVEDAYGSVKKSRLANFGPGDGQDVADEHVFEVLGLAGGFAHEKNGGGGSNGVSDADESFLGNVTAARASESEDSGAQERERETDPGGRTAVRVHAGDDGDGGAKRSDLGESEIHENDAALHNMHAKIGVNPGENEAGDEGREQKRKNFHSAVSRALFGCVESLLQLGNIVIKQLEIIGDFLFAADGGHEDDDLRAGVTSDGVWSFEVEVRLNKDDLDAVAFHQANQLDGVLRTWGNAGARLNVADDIETKVLGEIGPGAVIGDDFAAGIRLHLSEPFFISLLDALLKGVIALSKIGGIAGTHFGEFILNPLGDGKAGFGIETIMWVAEGGDV